MTRVSSSKSNFTNLFLSHHHPSGTNTLTPSVHRSPDSRPRPPYSTFLHDDPKGVRVWTGNDGTGTTQGRKHMSGGYISHRKGHPLTPG